MGQQFLEQLERVVEAEAPRLCLSRNDALQLQAPVASSARAAGHANGGRARGYWTGAERNGRRGRAACRRPPPGSMKQSSLRVGGAASAGGCDCISVELEHGVGGGGVGARGLAGWASGAGDVEYVYRSGRTLLEQARAILLKRETAASSEAEEHWAREMTRWAWRSAAIPRTA